MSPALQILFLLTVGGLLAGQETTAPASTVLVYTRDPLRIPVECRAADFEAANVQCSLEEPCQVFLELTTVEAVGSKVFLAGNLHTGTATLASLVLLSDDGGGRWREPFQRFPGASGEAVQFLNEQQGWIAVQPQQQFPADPFLMSTADGGVRWQNRRIFAEEGRAGLLQQFRFDSPQHGFVLIDRSQSGLGVDRYELYETLTGAASWLLRETSSRPIEPKWPERRPPEWRLRADARAKTYDVERRIGATWRRMASFHTDLVQCKELQSPLRRAPPPPDPAEDPDSTNPRN
jgi:hypothetical protein